MYSWRDARRACCAAGSRDDVDVVVGGRSSVPSRGGDSDSDTVQHTLQPKFKARVGVALGILGDDTRQHWILAAGENLLVVRGKRCLPLRLGHPGLTPGLRRRRLALRKAIHVGIHCAQNVGDGVLVKPKAIQIGQEYLDIAQCVRAGE